jgi:PAS domain S-box-containing protein
VQNELTFRQMVDGISALVAVLTPDGAVEFVNRQVLDYFGRTLEELKAWASTDAVHPDDRPGVVAVWRQSVESGQPYDIELRQRGADAVYRWFHVQGLPVQDAEGQIIRWCVLQTDIDEQRRAEEALRQSERHLRLLVDKLSAARQIATVAELSASIAHEVNQPLASVVTNAQACQTWLLHDPPNLDRAQATLERIIRDGHSAAEVVRRIRALFKEAAPVKALLNMNQLVAEVLRVLSDELRDNRIIVETELGADLPMIEADHVQIQQTLINLVHNAMEAMDGVTDRAKSLLLSSRHQGEELLIQVRDRGFGIEDPTLIFEPFFSTKKSGMGMGLSICRSIVEAHGGRVWAIANEDAGMTFSIALPVGARPSHSETGS